MKNTILKYKIPIAVILIVIIAVLACVAGFLSYTSKQTGFLENTTLNGEDISGKTVEEVTAAEAAKYSIEGKTVTLTENGEAALTASFSDLGYSFDTAAFQQLLSDVYRSQMHNPFTLLKTLISGTEVLHEENYACDEDLFNSVISSGNLADARFETTDGSVQLDAETDSYVVAAGVQGNMIDDALLQETVKQQLDEIVQSGDIPDNVEIAIPESVYTSAEPVNNMTELQEEADEQNAAYAYERYLHQLSAVTITYTFGTVTEVLTGDTFMNWITVDQDLNVTFDDEQVNAYVTELSSTYNTRYRERTFQTSLGTTVTIPSGDGEYGYTISKADEAALIKENILSLESVTREPVYYTENEYGNPYYLGREGTDDLNGTYVEVNLTQQHLWFYKNGVLIIESDLVSGDVSLDKETKTGCFPLAWKQSPRTLTGDEAGGSGSYSTDVQYWMPFYDGQGLHDAPWRTDFGGDIYLASGSHGCVNLPSAVAQTIYENIDVGTAIILYKDGQ